MNKISHGQKLFLSRLRRHRMIVRTARVLILVLFLILWEVCASTGIVDSFIFSSPSRIALCFWEMVLDRSIFLHIGITLYERLSVSCWSQYSASFSLSSYGAVKNSLKYWNLIWSS